MSEFPIVLPYDDGYRAPETPWVSPMTHIGWLEENMHRFLFPLESIRGGQVKYGEVNPPNSAGIYFLLWDGDIVYAGKSVDIQYRLHTHEQKGDIEFTHFWCFTGVPEPILEQVEYMYIQWLQPIMNTKCLGHTEVGDRLIADLEPYRPFRSVWLSPTRLRRAKWSDEE